MKIEAWIHFEEAGEKQKLQEIMENNSNSIIQNQKIQEEFNIDMFEAKTVIEMYNKRIKK